MRVRLPIGMLAVGFSCVVTQDATHANAVTSVHPTW
ncbi:MAG: hypothetical protein ACI835_004154 [Planctomycetota bacterium]|jgi:hypothetical protein